MRRVLAAVLVVMPSISAAQTAAPPPAEPRFFVDAGVAVGTSPHTSARDFRRPFITFGENALMAASYPALAGPSGMPVSLGASFMFKPRLGVGVSYSRETYEHGADLSATIPHPLFFQAPASDTGAIRGTLTGREGATHVSVAFVPFRSARMRVTVMGGPSFFQYSADMVEDVLYRHDFGLDTPTNVITIDGFTSQHITGRGVGVHMSGDFAYFFTRTIGASAGIRYSTGMVDVQTEPMSQLGQEFSVGSVAMILGVRFRFGG